MKQSKIFAFFLILFFAFFGIYRINPPNVASFNTPLTEFSSDRAMKHLEVIAQQPHPIGSPKNIDVSNYILNELVSLGLSPELQEATVVNQRWGSPFVAGTVHNIVAKLAGVNNTKGVLIAAHYDSVSNGPGASDDGAAVATMLETIRALKVGLPLKNDIIFLFTDGEEPGLLGAKAFVEEHPWAKDVGVVLNFEARGNSGPAIMFETSNNNGWLIQEFAKAAIHPVANSLTYSVYKLLPNDTDLTMFKQAGMTGLNFAYMNGLVYYHTAYDNLENIDKRSLQHQGNYALSLTHHFGNLRLDITHKTEAIYFDILGSVLIHYSQSFAIPLTALVTLLFVKVVALGLKRKLLSFPGVSLGFIALLLSASSTSITVSLSWWLIQTFQSEYQWLPQGTTYNSNLYAIAFVALNIAITSTIYVQFCKKVSLYNLTVGALLWWLILMVLTSLFLPGASYLFTWPTLFNVIGLILIFNTKNQKFVFWRHLTLLTLFAIPGIILLTPTIYLVFEALTLSMSGVVMILVVLLLSLLIPHLYFIANLNKWLLPTASIIISLSLILAGSLTSDFDANHPKPNSLFYALNADVGKAIWASSDEKPDKWTSQLLTANTTKKGALPEYLPMAQRKFLVSQAPILPLAAPSIQILDDKVNNRDSEALLPLRSMVKDNSADRTLHIRITSPRQARILRVYLDPSVQVVNSTVNGQQIANNTQSWGLHYFALPKEGVELTLAVKSSRPIKLKVVDQSDGLPKIPGKSFQERPNSMMPTAFGYGVSDSILVSKSFTF